MSESIKGTASIEKLIKGLVKSVKVSLDGFQTEDISTHIDFAMKAAGEWREAHGEIKDLTVQEAVQLVEIIAREVRLQLLENKQ